MPDFVIDGIISTHVNSPLLWIIEILGRVVHVVYSWYFAIDMALKFIVKAAKRVVIATRILLLVLIWIKLSDRDFSLMHIDRTVHICLHHFILFLHGTFAIVVEGIR